MGRIRKRPTSSAYLAFAKRYRQRIEERASLLENEALRYEVERQEERKMYVGMREDKEPLSPAQWIDNPYFSGHLARDMYDKLKEEFCDIYENNYFEVIMGGAIGWGKTTFCMALQAYSIHLLTHYGVPQHAFRGMLESAQILYLNLNTKKEKAKDSYFVPFTQLLESIPYHKEEYSLKPNLVNSIVLPKGILCKFSGATKTAAESENLIFVVLDEVNLYDIVERSKRAVHEEKYDAAEMVFASALRRMQTRYMMPDGSMPLPCKIISLCKETYHDSFIRRRIAEVKKKEMQKGIRYNENVKIMEFSEWETKPSGTYEKKYFWIKTATRTESAEIIRESKKAKAERMRLKELVRQDVSEDEKYEVIRVPTAGGEYLYSAQKDLPNFIRDVCGRPTEALRLFFPRREPIFDAIREPGPNIPPLVCEHPFNSLTTNFYDGTYLIKERLCEGEIQYDDRDKPIVDKDGKILLKWRPIINPAAPRIIAVDTSISGDPCGLSMGHIYGWKDIITRSVEDKAVYETLPVVWVDFMLRILPPPGGEIPYAAILGLIRTIRDHLGFSILMVVLDIHQRVALTQPLEHMGIDWKRISVDETTGPYERLKSMYLTERIKTYAYEPGEEELTSLELVKLVNTRGTRVEKVDHPPDGKKDVADTLARIADAVEEYAALMTPVLPPDKKRTEIKTDAQLGLEKQQAFESGNFEKLFDMLNEEKEWY